MLCDPDIELFNLDMDLRSLFLETHFEHFNIILWLLLYWFNSLNHQSLLLPSSFMRSILDTLLS